MQSGAYPATQPKRSGRRHNDLPIPPLAGEDPNAVTDQSSVGGRTTAPPVPRGQAARYRGARRRACLLIAAAFIGLIVLAGTVAIRGINETSLATLAVVIAQQIGLGGLFHTPADPMAAQVLLHLRLPRVIMAMLAGAALSVSGVLMQAITRNPLVSPYTIGVSSAASFGAAIAIMFGVGWHGAGVYLIPASAFVFAILAALAVFGMTWWRGMGPQAMILTGIALMYLFSAMTAAVQFIANEEQLARVVHWTFGSLNGVRWPAVGICAAVVAVVLPLIQARAWQLNVLTVAGDEVARTLGVNVTRLRGLAIGLAVVSAAVVISFVGVIGFVGLIGPHVARLLIGGDHRVLIPFAAITGAALLLVADTVGRLAFSPVVIPVGIVVAFVGVPLFLHLILSRKKESFS